MSHNVSASVTPASPARNRRSFLSTLAVAALAPLLPARPPKHHAAEGYLEGDTLDVRVLDGASWARKAGAA